jgi:hypothetical protein
MAHDTHAISDLLERLRTTVGTSARLHVINHADGSLTIQVGDDAETAIGVSVRDERRPSYCVSYPKLSIKRNGDRHISTVTSDGVLAGGVTWIIEQLAQHGVVRPEFID